MEHLVIAATVFLILFAIVASIDGLYFHLYKYRLYLREESLREHKLHTIRAFLFVPIVFLLFARNFAGALIWVALIVILADLVVEMLDVVSEKDSRAGMGGLSTAEYATHIVATTLRVAALGLILAAKPAPAWDFAAPIVADEDYPAMVRFTALNIIASSLIGGALHVWLMRKKYRTAKGSISPVMSSEGE